MRIFLLVIGVVLCCTGCNPDNPNKAFCRNTTPDSFNPNFVVECPTKGSDYYLPVKYGCPPNGEGISHPLAGGDCQRGRRILGFFSSIPTVFINVPSAALRSNGSSIFPLSKFKILPPFRMEELRKELPEILLCLQ